MKEYFKLKRECKIGLKKEIKRIDEVVKQLAEVVVEQNNFIEELKKDNYKDKFRAEHKRYIELEKESQEIIEELTTSLKKAERENRKLKKEAQND